MGNLSEHFNYRDFSCKCRQCRNEVKVHLGLVGALEAISEHFRRVPRIAEAYRCENINDAPIKKNSHRQGRAAHIYMDGISLQDLYAFILTLPEIRGVGFYPTEKVLHIDTRIADKDLPKELWAKENGKILPLTGDIKAKYGIA